MAPEDTSERLRATLTLEGSEGDRWKVRVDLRPLAEAIPICGVTVGFVDASGDPLGPAVVLGLDRCIAAPTTVFAAVKGPARLQGHMALRLTAYASDCEEAIRVDHIISGQRGFRSYLTGVHSLETGPAPAGRPLTEDEQDLLARHFPWAFTERVSSREAFDAFQDDFRDTFDLEETDGITEEILRMMKEA